MITKFDSSYVGSVDLEDAGYLGKPINDRLVFQRGAGRRHAQDGGLCQADGPAGLQHLLDGRAPFPAGRDGVHPQPADDGDAPLRRDQESQHRLRLQHRADVASAPTGGRLRHGRHPDRRPRDLRHRPRLSHPRGRDLRLAADRPGRQPRAVRGRRRRHLQGLQRGALQPQGQVLHDPARGALSRLHAEGTHPGAAAAAPAGRMLAADPERLAARLRLHGQVRHLGRDRRRLGRGRRRRPAHDGVPRRLSAPRHRAQAGRAPGARLPVLHRRKPRGGHRARPPTSTKRT